MRTSWKFISFFKMVTQALHFQLGHSGQLLSRRLQRNNIHIPVMTLWRQPRSPTQLTYVKYISPSCYLRKQKPTKLGYYRAKWNLPVISNSLFSKIENDYPQGTVWACRTWWYANRIWANFYYRITAFVCYSWIATTIRKSTGYSWGSLFSKSLYISS